MEHRIIFSDAFIVSGTHQAQYKSVKKTTGNISVVYTVKVHDGVAVFSIGVAEKTKSSRRWKAGCSEQEGQRTLYSSSSSEETESCLTSTTPK
jgi:hypothetical protein